MKKFNRVRFLDPREIEETLAEISEVASQAGHKHVALIGGVAMMAYGSDRLTADVDVAASGPLPFRIIKGLSFGGYACETLKGHRVDVVIRDDDYRELYDEAVARAQDVGLSVLVVPPEYLAAMKMAAGRDKDLLDLKTLIGLDAMDRQLVRNVVKDFLGPYAARELDSLYSEVEWEHSKESK